MDPSTEPCGTPDVTSHDDDDNEPSIEQPVGNNLLKNDLIKLIINGLWYSKTLVCVEVPNGVPC